MLENFERLCWRYCILVEENYGTTECLITLHTLTHVPEDIKRLSSPDKCYQYERAVGRYVRQSSNKKGIEKTFARDESQREFIKFSSEQHQLGTQVSQSGIYDISKVNKIFFETKFVFGVNCWLFQKELCSSSFF